MNRFQHIYIINIYVILVLFLFIISSIFQTAGFFFYSSARLERYLSDINVECSHCCFHQCNTLTSNYCKRLETIAGACGLTTSNSMLLIGSVQRHRRTFVYLTHIVLELRDSAFINLLHKLPKQANTSQSSGLLILHYFVQLQNRDTNSFLHSV